MSAQYNRKRLLIIFAWFLIPLFGAFAWYKLLPDNYRPARTTNNGDILEFIFTLEKFSHQDTTGATFSNIDIEKVWTLVHFVNGDCDQNCSQSLYNTRQLRISLGKDIDRLNRVVILTPQGQTDSNQRMWASHPDLRVLIANQNGVKSQIQRNISDITIEDTALFLIDPLGNVMMHFSAKLTPKEIKKDIRKLFKLSHIG